MALIGKVVGCVEISSGGKVLHDLLRHKPNDISTISPGKVHACDLLSGRRGAVGATIVWHFTHDGKKANCKRDNSRNRRNKPQNRVEGNWRRGC
ncbi:hypothetical protein FEC37_18650 [Acinetobacter baumannii]|uniref:hypothetical protein n=1 Tax=Acinetobacter baumannii TaxID=470 RepID=UPI0010FD470C|nr:hypothetical protein FEC37_18650 [Acinetobacter baumannii]